MSLIDSFVRQIEQEQLFSKEEGLLLAVSGGVDSVVLCDVLHKTGYRFAIAHCNFQLRGEDSRKDEAFVQSLATTYHCKIWIRRFETEEYAKQKGLSIQEAARALRYQWFDQLMEEEASDYRWLLTAHHADDNVETIVMHFFRGTGIAGLRGMRIKHDRLVRPLLPFHKTELIQHAKTGGLEWREDMSNVTEKYTRNYFRLQVLPLIEKIYPAAAANVLDNAVRFKEVEEVYRQAIERYRREWMKPSGAEFHISIGKLRQQTPLRTILYELLKPFGFRAAQVDDIRRLMDGETGRFVMSESHRIIRNRKWLVVAPAADRGVSHFVIDPLPQIVHAGDFDLHLSIEEAAGGTDPGNGGEMCLNADALAFPLLLRGWKPGDYFYPLGMKKKKKVARFLIDQKVSKTHKEKTWVLLSGDRIICVIGRRIDDRFKLTPSTKQMLRIDYRPFE